MLISISFHSCYYDNNEDLHPNNDTIITSDCDTVLVTYNVQIKPFFDANCISCHSSGGTHPYLNDYTDAHNYAITPSNKLNNYLLNDHEGISTTACQKAQVKKWIDTGAN